MGIAGEALRSCLAVQVGEVDASHLPQRDQYPQAEEQVARTLGREACGQSETTSLGKANECPVLFHNKVSYWTVKSSQQQTHKQSR
jgi:hypothetical protein